MSLTSVPRCLRWGRCSLEEQHRQLFHKRAPVFPHEATCLQPLPAATAALKAAKIPEQDGRLLKKRPGSQILMHKHLKKTAEESETHTSTNPFRLFMVFLCLGMAFCKAMQRTLPFTIHPQPTGISEFSSGVLCTNEVYRKSFLGVDLIMKTLSISPHI